MRNSFIQLRFSILISIVLFFPSHRLLAQESYDSIAERFHISGEAGGAFFDTGSEGAFPNDEFRVDEAKLFVEAAILDDVYFFSEVNVLTREEPDEQFDLGELYVQFENISKLWHREEMLNARVGRFDIPFGEEYLSRDAIDDPLISHSLSDLWGVDEGIELYGSYKTFQYVFAVQNGGEPILHDYTSDKSVAGRLTYRPNGKIHFSLSSMRTGDIDARRDRYAALWFGNSDLHSLGLVVTTKIFNVNLIQADGDAKWQKTRFHAGVGRLRYNDDNTADNDRRTAHYYQVEGAQDILNYRENSLYAALRFSRITTDDGFPIAGNGTLEKSAYYTDRLTDRIWRLSFGIGYRIGRHVLFKTEYNIEHGTQSDGSKRDKENFFGAEAAFRF